MVTRILWFGLCIVIMVGVSGCRHGLPYYLRGLTEDTSLSPFLYGEYEKAGGRIIRMETESPKRPPYRAGDAIYATLQNTTQQDLCLYIDEWNTVDKSFIIPAAVSRGDWYGPAGAEDVISVGVSLDETRAIILPPGKHVRVKLTLGTYNYYSQPKGRFWMYYHIFVPECGDTKVERDSIRSPHMQLSLRYDWYSNFGHYNFVFEDKPDEIYKIITPRNTRGALFTAKIDVHL